MRPTNPTDRIVEIAARLGKARSRRRTCRNNICVVCGAWMHKTTSACTPCWGELKIFRRYLCQSLGLLPLYGDRDETERFRVYAER